jgi:hypothetical protein
MIDYNTLVFTFLWCDLAQELSRIHKVVQRNNLQISDVGRSITLLCVRLKDEYPLDSEIPKRLPWTYGYAPYIMQQFWGKDYLIGIF